MEHQKNLCAQIPLSLHAKVRKEQEKSGQSLSAYITQLLTNYYEKGDKPMEFTKTLAFQIPEELFNRIKDHQKDFVISLIERELEEAERQAVAESEEAGYADVG